MGLLPDRGRTGDPELDGIRNKEAATALANTLAQGGYSPEQLYRMKQFGSPAG